MSETTPSRAPWFIAAFLVVVCWSATIALPLALLPEAHRPPTLEVSIIIACLLELALGGYLAFVFTPCLHVRVPAALVPGWGTLLGLYTMGCAGTLVRCAYYPRLYALLLSLETIVFLILAGGVLLVGRGRIAEEVRAREDRAGAQAWMAQVRSLRPAFEAVGSPLPLDQKTGCAKLLRRIEERGRQITPLGRQGREAQDAPVFEQARLLAQTISILDDAAPENLPVILDQVSKEATMLLRSMDTREASLIR